jgi:chemotaxis response regulator CheB
VLLARALGLPSGNTPPISGFRPSATYLFESAARFYGAGVAAVILTGMGATASRD